MNGKLLRFLSLLLEVICLTVVIGVSVYGIVVTDDDMQIRPYIMSVVRASIIFLMTISYYKTSVSSFNPGNPFAILFLLFISIAELRILTVFTTLTGWSILPPRVSVRLQIFAQFMVYFLMSGYAMNYQNNDRSAVTRFLFFGTASCLFVSILIPATQDIIGVWELKAPFIFLTALFSVSILTNAIIFFSEPSALGKLRHISTLMLLIGNYVAIVFYSSSSISLVATCLFFAGGLINMIVTLRNSVIL